MEPNTRVVVTAIDIALHVYGDFHGEVDCRHHPGRIVYRRGSPHPVFGGLGARPLAIGRHGQVDPTLP